MSTKYGPPVPEIKKWIDALRSGKYPQTRGTLQDEGGFCCLGVACEMFSPKHQYEAGRPYLRGGTPSEQRHAPTWLKRVNDDFIRRTRVKDEDGYFDTMSLIDLNDDEDLTFDEIADALQLVYVEKAFE